MGSVCGGRPFSTVVMLSAVSTSASMDFSVSGSSSARKVCAGVLDSRGGVTWCSGVFVLQVTELLGGGGGLGSCMSFST